MSLKFTFCTVLSSLILASCSNVLVQTDMKITKRETSTKINEYEVIEKFLSAEEIKKTE